MINECHTGLWSTPHKRQNPFVIVGTPTFEGHVTPNKDEYKKSVGLKFRYCHGVLRFTISLLIMCIPAEETDFEIGHFHTPVSHFRRP